MSFDCHHWALVALMGGALGCAAVPAFGQSAPPPAAAPAQNPLLEPARLAFTGLAEADRKAIQDDLVWASSYSSILDGEFGRGTFDAILAFELKARLKADGILEPGERERLAAEATRLRKLVGFQTVTDARSGARISLPTRAFDRSAPVPRGMQWSRKAGHFVLTTEAYKPGEADLGALFEATKLPGPTRKVTYAVKRDTWFVVAGEADGRRFYTRFAAGPEAAVTGYTLSADKATPDLDRITVAIANSFEPFAAANAAVANVTGGANVAGGAGAQAGQGGQPGVPAAKPSAGTTTVAAPAVPLIGTGLVVAPGRILTVTRAVDGCRTLTVRGRPAKVARADAESGLALLEAEGVTGGTFAFRVTPPGMSDPLLVLAGADRSGVVVAAGEAVAAPAGGRSAFRVLTPLQSNGGGATVTDRSGAVAALVVGPAGEPRRIAGVVPEAAQEAVAAEAMARFLGASGILIPAAPAGATRTAGEVAASLKSAVAPLLCSR